MGEQATPASDLYSVGLLGVFLLGGEIPHSRWDRDGNIQPFDRACIIQRLGANSVKVLGRRGLEPVSDAFCKALEESLFRVPEDRYHSAVEFRIALRDALPDLGLPNLPVYTDTGSVRKTEIVSDRTLLEVSLEGAEERDDGSPTMLGLPSIASTLSAKDAGTDSSQLDLGRASVSAHSHDRSIGTDAPFASAPELFVKRMDPPRQRRRLWLSLLIVMLGVAIFWFLKKAPAPKLATLTPKTSSSQTSAGTVTSALVSTTQSEVKQFAVPIERETITSQSTSTSSNEVEKKVDANLPADVAKTREAEARVAPRRAQSKDTRPSSMAAKVTKRAQKRMKKVVQNDKSKVLRQPKRGSGKRCRQKFRHIVSESEGQNLRSESPLCDRIRRLVSEAKKPKCGLKAKERKELDMLEVLCTM